MPNPGKKVQTTMITKPAKKSFIPLVACFTDRTLNPREQVDTSYLSETMIASLASIGQQTTGKVLKKGDKFLNLQGNRRWANMVECQKRGIIDPKTMKYDRESGKPIEGTGKVFEAWEVEVYEDLTPREILELVVDQGTIRPLNKVETYYAFEQCAKVHYSELETIVILGDLLELHYPPTRAIKTDDKGKDLRDYYHGVMQTFRRVYEAPLVLHDACVAKLRGDQKWPTNAELTQGHKIHMDEMKADKTGTISRTRPGPKFLEFWERKLKSVNDSETNGTNKPKSVSMMTNQGLQDSKKTFDSRLGKWFHAFVLREVSPETAPMIDSLLSRFETGVAVPLEEIEKTLNDAFAATLSNPEKPAA